MIVRNVFIAVLALFFIWGCSSTSELINLSAEDRFANGMRLYNDEDYLEAINEFQSLLLQYPGNEVADDAQYYLAMSRYERGEQLLAAYEFSKLIKNMPASDFVPNAQYMLAESYYQLSPNFALDQSYTINAIKEFQAFIEFFPTDERVTEAEKKMRELNDKLAQKEYNTAYIYERLEYNTAALIYYNSVLETYHDTRFAPMASYNKIKLLIERNRNEEALVETKRFLEKFPDNNRYVEVEGIRKSLEQKHSAATR
jgi:outer membrane protein assembly factor BamD